MKLCQAYNCEIHISVLDGWDLWSKISVEPASDKGTPTMDTEDYANITKIFFPVLPPKPDDVLPDDDTVANQEEEGEEGEEELDEEGSQSEENVEEVESDDHLD